MATLTYDYADQTAVLGPLATASEPHTYDLCDDHAQGLTVPRGWQVVRLATKFDPVPPSPDDLMALIDVIRGVAGDDRADSDSPRPFPTRQEKHWGRSASASSSTGNPNPAARQEPAGQGPGAWAPRRRSGSFEVIEGQGGPSGGPSLDGTVHGDHTGPLSRPEAEKRGPEDW